MDLYRESVCAIVSEEIHSCMYSNRICRCFLSVCCMYRIYLGVCEEKRPVNYVPMMGMHPFRHISRHMWPTYVAGSVTTTVQKKNSIIRVSMIGVADVWVVGSMDRWSYGVMEWWQSTILVDRDVLGTEGAKIGCNGIWNTFVNIVLYALCGMTCQWWFVS